MASLLSTTSPDSRWTRCAQLLAVADHAPATGVAEATSAVLLRRAATYLWRRGEL